MKCRFLSAESYHAQQAVLYFFYSPGLCVCSSKDRDSPRRFV